MPIEILMPALSPTMTEGTLAKWNVKEGDTVVSGDIIAEIETDKATMELEAVDEGTIGKILIDAGTQNVPVNQPVAILLEEGEDASAMDAMQSKPEPVAPVATETQKPTAPIQAPKSSDSSAAAAGLMMGFGGFDLDAPAARVFASPLARRVAKNANVDIAQVKGSGPRGRIIRKDVEEAIANGTLQNMDAEIEAAMAVAMGVKAPKSDDKPASAPKSAAPAADYGTPYTEEPHSGMRKIIASRLTESKQTVPHFYVTMDVNLDELLAMRGTINERAKDKGGQKISVNDFIIRACALALKNVPEANVSWTDTVMRQFSRSDISVAVATPSGLLTPVVRGACSKSLGNISTEMRDLAGRARDGKLLPEEYQGGTFSISNLGMFGVREFAAIINPPQSMLLAVGTTEQRPIVKDGALSIATMMSLTLSCDHRCIDGALGAKFLGEVKSLLEDPMSILL